RPATSAKVATSMPLKNSQARASSAWTTRCPALRALPENQGAVEAPESTGVDEHRLELHRTRSAGGDAQITAVRGLSEVDRRRQLPVAHGQEGRRDVEG